MSDASDYTARLARAAAGAQRRATADDPYKRACEEVQRAARLVAAEREFVRWADPDSDDYLERIEKFAASEVALWKALREMHAARPHRQGPSIMDDAQDEAASS